MFSLRHKLMFGEIEKRLNSAHLLLQAQDTSDSAYLLRLLALELLLKMAVERVTLHKAPPSHHYDELFKSLPEALQVKVLSLAAERVGPSALSSNYLPILRELGRNFIDLRYPFTRYENLNEVGYLRRGVKWAARGSLLERAEFRYHSEELLGLTFAFQKILVAEMGPN